VDIDPVETAKLTVHSSDGLQRHFGLLQAIALNVTMVVGAGVFATIPLILQKLPGPYALLPWVAAGALIILDGFIWSELATMFPGSGGSYRYLLEGYGREKWGRMMAFLFIWQFLLSGPLEIASGLIVVAQFATYLSPDLNKFNSAWEYSITLWDAEKVQMIVSPTRIGVQIAGLFLIFLLYRRISSLGKLTITFWIGVMAVIVWILVEGGLHFQKDVAFDWPDQNAVFQGTWDFLQRLGQGMILVMYCYLGYYNVCYIGDEVRDPGRTLPRAILGSAVLVIILFIGLQLAMLGTISWREAAAAPDDYVLPGEFMKQLQEGWLVQLVMILLIWTVLGSAFAGLLGYSRIPYGAARAGHFFSVFRPIHPAHRIPHVSLLFVGALTLFWCFFTLSEVINALVTTRILEQFVAQIGAVVLLRHNEPDRPRPFRLWLYPLPCGLALVGWLFMYVSARPLYIGLGLSTLVAGVVAFFAWSYWVRQWPFSWNKTGTN
jgi:APA family basic amino acid/polyamine antiporter